jgi:hypothetical protein
MPKLLTRLKISEVSSVDRGAGGDCRILLMKRHKDVAAKAVAALEKSVASIIDCNENAATKRFALAESFAQFQTYMDREANGKLMGKGVLERTERGYRQTFEKIFGKADDGDDDEKDDKMTEIDKAHRDRGAGPHGLTGALLEHLHDRLERRREQHGYQKREEGSLDQHQELISIMKDCGGPVALCKGIVDRGRSPCGEHRLVAAITKAAAEQFNMSGDRAFAKLYESEESVRRACSLAKSAEFSVFDIEPIVVGGPDEMHAAVNDTEQSAVLRAHEEIVRIAREKFPFLPSDVAYARIFEDKNYAALAAQAHRRPGVYAMPNAVAYAKADPMPNTNTLAYAELMRKAAELRKAQPELSEAQAFSKIYTDAANLDLAKRERIESAPR